MPIHMWFLEPNVTFSHMSMDVGESGDALDMLDTAEPNIVEFSVDCATCARRLDVYSVVNFSIARAKQSDVRSSCFIPQRMRIDSEQHTLQMFAGL